MSRSRRDVFAQPADRLLLRLRERRIAYRCDEHRDGRWHAACPACGDRLTIDEHGRGGRVTLRCAARCDGERVRHAIEAPDRCRDCGTVFGRVEALSRAADDALEIAHAQQRILRALLAEREAPQLREAA